MYTLLRNESAKKVVEKNPTSMSLMNNVLSRFRLAQQNNNKIKKQA
jgi:hypothetical protein